MLQVSLSIQLTKNMKAFEFLCSTLCEFLLAELRLMTINFIKTIDDENEETIELLTEFAETLPTAMVPQDGIAALISLGIPALCSEAISMAATTSFHHLVTKPPDCPFYDTLKRLISQVITPLLQKWGVQAISVEKSSRDGLAIARAAGIFDLAKEWPDSAQTVADITKAMTDGMPRDVILNTLSEALATAVNTRLLLPSVTPSVIMTMLSCLHGTLTAVGAGSIISTVSSLISSYISRADLKSIDLIPAVLENIDELRVDGAEAAVFDPQPMCVGHSKELSLASIFVQIFGGETKFVNALHAKMCLDLIGPSVKEVALEWTGTVEKLKRVIAADKLVPMDVVLHDIAETRRTIATAKTSMAPARLQALQAQSVTIISHEYWAEVEDQDYMSYAAYPRNIAWAIKVVADEFHTLKAPRHLVPTDYGIVTLAIEGKDVTCSPLEAVVISQFESRESCDISDIVKNSFDGLPPSLSNEASDAVKRAVDTWIQRGVLVRSGKTLSVSDQRGPVISHGDDGSGPASAWDEAGDKVWAWLKPFLASRPADLPGLTLAKLHQVMCAFVGTWRGRTEVETERLLMDAVGQGLLVRADGVFKLA
ncbi:Anaphase-promoting complex subunit 2 [Carpediemonas membranifera]|uniref:Anaphase-promoting complex subunit 2 n=1 Tax=Carpediemonas membranifera TaxID=201153 RepID=A0A8J6B3A6_9EUKA|nr:Anaphase-promoting complex subunit 2 [Carpediemonas membranifera]|eukprot:KAG9397425.1 Anaphase-promoting complex subunit 2 [Carpediemonas membranifera]